MAVNAWRFGWVMSYQKGTTAVACYGYEPCITATSGVRRRRRSCRRLPARQGCGPRATAFDEAPRLEDDAVSPQRGDLAGIESRPPQDPVGVLAQARRRVAQRQPLAVDTHDGEPRGSRRPSRPIGSPLARPWSRPPRSPLDRPPAHRHRQGRYQLIARPRAIDEASSGTSSAEPRADCIRREPGSGATRARPEAHELCVVADRHDQCPSAAARPGTGRCRVRVPQRRAPPRSPEVPKDVGQARHTRLDQADRCMRGAPTLSRARRPASARWRPAARR